MSKIINGIHYYEKESDAKEGFAVIPTGKDGSGIVIVIHGIGEVGDGSLNQLQNIMEGWDYDGDGPRPREFAMPIPEYKKNLKDFNILGVHINYKSSFTLSDFDYVINTVVADFKGNRNCVSAICFSLGGNQLIPFITSSVENAKKLVLAVLCAPVNPGGNWLNVVDAKLQVIGTSYAVDKRVPSDNVKRAIADINRLNPTIKPVYKEWPGENHGTLNEMMADPAIFQYMNSVSTSDRKQFTFGTTPIPPVVVPPTTSIKAVASYTGTGPAIRLIGEKSTGWKTGYEGTWAFVSGPAGVTAKQVFPGGSSFINANANLPIPGTYVFRLNLTGTTPAEITVVYGTTTQPKEILSFDSGTDLITFKDNTTEIGRSIYKDGKWKIIAASGVPYDL